VVSADEAGAALDGVVARAIEAGRIVGTVILIHKDGRLRYRTVAGLADREANHPMAEDTVFRLASMTKPIVSVATLALAESGVLGLDDAVTRFLPDFRPRTAEGGTPAITIRHLLTHTAGLSYGFLQEGEGVYRLGGISDGLDRPGISLEENLRRIVALPLGYVPGTRWHYSLATDVLGAVLAAATGFSLPDVVRDRVTRPLAMGDTHFLAPSPKWLATPYGDGEPLGTPARRMTDPFVLQPLKNGPVHFSPGRATDPQAYASGGVGMVGTAADYMRFLEALRLGGAPVLRRDSVAALTTDAVPTLEIDIAGPGWGFGLGVGHLRDPKAAAAPMSAGSWNWGGVYGTSFWVDPAEGLSAVALTNTAIEGTNGDFTRDIVAAAYLGKA
jgi:CubicO group peptidase (beta-lactamase class C family)